MSETNQLTQQIINYLNSRGAYAWRNNTGATVYEDPKRSGRARFLRYGKKGSGDILAVLPGGTFLSVEVKVGQDRLRDSQREWIREIERVGGLTLVAHEIEDVITFLRHWERDHAPTQVKVVTVPTTQRQVIVRKEKARRSGARATPNWVMDDPANGVAGRPVAVMEYDAQRGKWVKVASTNARPKR